MTDEISTYAARAAMLREAFDRSFASPPRPATDDLERVLTFSVAGDRFAVRLLEISGMAKKGKITPIPNNTRALAGLAGIRGELLPVYSLAVLLDYAGDAEIRWLLICGETARIALGVSDFYGCFNVLKSAFSTAEGSAAQESTKEIVVVGSDVYTVIGIASLLKSIRDLKKKGI